MFGLKLKKMRIIKSDTLTKVMIVTCRLPNRNYLVAYAADVYELPVAVSLILFPLAVCVFVNISTRYEKGVCNFKHTSPEATVGGSP